MGKTREKHIGEIVGVFKIIETLPGRLDDGHLLYKGICIECGYERIAKYSDLKATKKCNHIRTNGQVISKRTKWSNKRIQSIFHGMKNKCYKENNKEYTSCGAKGIKICDEWLNDPSKFEKWAIENGYSDDLVIHRIDKNKDYCPENCKWTTNEYNQKRKSTSNIIDIDGQIDSGAGWSIKLGFGKNYINTFIRKYGLETAISCIREKLNGHDDAFKINKTQASVEKSQTIKHKKENIVCKICGSKIRDDNKYGMCYTCLVSTRREDKIKHWLETGDTGTAPAHKPPDVIRQYIFKQQDGKCALCGIANNWNGKELKFVFDHIDGNAADSSPSNVRLICPNCDSQLDTFKSKNKNSARQFRHKYT